MAKSRFLTKFPVSVNEQKYARENTINGEIKKFKTTISKRFESHYGFFSIDPANNVNFIITLRDKRNQKTYYLRIAKQHIYDSLLTFLQYRPIRREGRCTEQLYCQSERLHKLERHNGELYNSSITEVRERFDTVKTELGNAITDSPSPVSKRTAELQYNRLIEAQWKMELLSLINQSEKRLKEIKLSDIEEYEKKFPHVSSLN